MCKNLLSKQMYDYLTWHSNEIAKEQEILFKELYTEETNESMNFEAFFKEYLSNLGSYLSNASIGKGGITNCPFIIIGSIVDVHDSDEKEDYQYRIVLPYTKQQDINIDCASCLSPLGKSLLFQSEKENISVQIPAGELHYSIKKITLPEAAENALINSTDILSSVFPSTKSINF